MSRPLLLALLALAASPSAALAAHQHDLQLDKQEIFQQVESGGAIVEARASCNSGYKVLSGSIRVDTVPGGSLTNVRVRTSAPDTSDEKWFYELVNTAPAGNQAAQIKLMISCIRPVTSGGSGGQHALTFNRQDSALSVPGGLTTDSTKSIDCATTTPTDRFGYIPSGYGWVFDPDSAYNRLSGVMPSVEQVGRGWFPTGTQTAYLAGSASQPAYTLYDTAYCLKHLTELATGEGRSHRHYLNVSAQSTTVNIGQTTRSGYYSQSVSCPSGSYAIAPNWFIDPVALNRGLRIVGIGYQGDQDVFRIVNPNGPASAVDVGVICLATKTSFTDQPTAGAGPGPQRLLLSQKASALTVAPGTTTTAVRGCAGKTDIVTAGGIGGAGAAAVRVLSSGGGPKATKWRFVLRNPGAKPAHLTLGLTCLSPWAEGHTLVIRALPAQAPDGVATCPAGDIPIRPSTTGDLTSGARFNCLEPLTTQRINHVHRLSTTTVSSVVGAGQTKTLACAPHYGAVTPRVTPGKGARLIRSMPDGRGWTFGFAGHGRSTARLTCLKDSTSPEIAQPIVQPVVAG